VVATAQMPMPQPAKNPVPSGSPNNVVLSPPAYMLSPDMLPAPEMSSVHGGTLSGAGSAVDVAVGNRNYKWAAGVFALAAVAGVITAVVTQLGGGSSDMHTVPWETFLPIVHLPDVPDSPPPTKPAPPPQVQQTLPQPPIPAVSAEALAAGSASGSAATGSAAGALVDAKIDGAKGSDRPRRNANGRLSGATTIAAHNAKPDAVDPAASGRLRIEKDSCCANVTIRNMTRQAPGAHFVLPAGTYTAHVMDDDGGFNCKVTVEADKTTSYTLSMDDERCERIRDD
jgi:hypothetical protein